MTPGKRAAAKIGGSLAAAAATSVVVGWLADADSLRRWLLSVAGALELWGVLLVASPELAPILGWLHRAVTALPSRAKSLARRAADWVRAKLGDPRDHIASGTATASGGGATRSSGYKDLPEEATPEEKIDFLMEQSKETQLRLNHLQQRANDLPERWQGDIEGTAGTLRQEQQQGLAGLRKEHLTARLGGVVLLLVGLALATWGNLA